MDTSVKDELKEEMKVEQPADYSALVAKRDRPEEREPTPNYVNEQLSISLHRLLTHVERSLLLERLRQIIPCKSIYMSACSIDSRRLPKALETCAEN